VPITFKREYPAILFHLEISSYHILPVTLTKKVVEFIFGFSGVIHPTETDFDNFRSDYLGKNETIYETALARV
jgi:hypothetical protein